MEKRSLPDIIKEKADKDPGFAIAFALLEIDETLQAAMKVFSAHAFEGMLGDKANAESLAIAIGGIADSIQAAGDDTVVFPDP